MSKKHYITPHEEQVPALAKGVEVWYEDIKGLPEYLQIAWDNGCHSSIDLIDYHSPYEVGDTLAIQYWASRWIDDTIESGHYEDRLEVLDEYEVTSVGVEQVEETWKFRYGVKRI
jgi:hypothetical protein